MSAARKLDEVFPALVPVTGDVALLAQRLVRAWARGHQSWARAILTQLILRADSGTGMTFVGYECLALDVGCSRATIAREMPGLVADLTCPIAIRVVRRPGTSPRYYLAIRNPSHDETTVVSPRDTISQSTFPKEDPDLTRARSLGPTRDTEKRPNASRSAPPNVPTVASRPRLTCDRPPERAKRLTGQPAPAPRIPRIPRTPAPTCSHVSRDTSISTDISARAPTPNLACHVCRPIDIRSTTIPMDDRAAGISAIADWLAGAESRSHVLRSGSPFLIAFRQ